MPTTSPPNDLTSGLTSGSAASLPPAEALVDAGVDAGVDEGARRRQAQLAIPPPISWQASGAASATDSPTAQDPESADATARDSASFHLPEPLAFRRILVPLDGSERAERAIPVAARIAKASGGSVLLVQAAMPQALSVVGSAPAEASMAATLEAAAAYLRQVAKRQELDGVEVEYETLRSVSPAAALLEAIERYACDLVVICSHGRSGILRWALGSIAQKLVRHAPVPVLVLRPDGPLPWAQPTSGTDSPVRALVTLDGSALAEAALIPAARLVAALSSPGRGELHLLRVIDHDDVARETPALPYRDPRVEALEEARTYLYAVSRLFGEGELAKLGLKISWSMRADADAVCGILEEAEDEAGNPTGGMASDEANSSRSNTSPTYNLVAMATHGRSGLKLWAEGSATDRVLQTTHMPLLVVRPSATEE